MIDIKKYNPGDYVWCVDLDCSCGKYIYMAVCGNYIICTLPYKGCMEFDEQLKAMARNSIYGGVDVCIIHCSRTFETKEMAEKWKDKYADGDYGYINHNCSNCQHYAYDKEGRYYCDCYKDNEKFLTTHDYYCKKWKGKK